ncbi:DUF374 domain-containing protein [Stappia taiwanensis]|uniref:DUF374 domain-containing protein n=1 Tax=Stappia taiwanensis TaxID=992267 RepID=A0A838XZ39_9HYPH|nr:lysophospholipid acyltransferase family protein [Stappia taiwanensis]MBA4612020.1 DUF374 domain-containing protein [Stappia taiwanensis]GGE91766.1 hypothetical protein GCM10007285_19180 [Stappia taiwanensis]
MLKRIGRHPLVVNAGGALLAGYLRLVRRTSKLRFDPPNFHEIMGDNRPAIVTSWHGQHFLMPFARPEGWDVRVMISRSADGEINAIAARKLGLGTIRASGAHKAHQISKRGGLRGFIEALNLLKAGGFVAMSADVPKVSRIAGAGIITLARHSGRPIFPIAIATSRHITLGTWDRATINLPFSRMIIAAGEPVTVPKDADDALCEDLRRQLEDNMNAATERAWQLARQK